jgi:NAD-dependent deacetylase
MDKKSRYERRTDRNLPENTHKAIAHAAELIRRARRGAVLTGAGISTPSGIPDFRSPHSGLWERHNPMEVASLRVFRYTPDRFYRWFRPLASLILAAQPNAAHLSLARLEQAGHIDTIITQNIDSLHQQAGSKRVLQVHGTLDSLTCVQCFEQVAAAEVSAPYLESGEIPRCPQCGGVLKPNAVLFEEQLPLHIWRKAEQACKECDLLIVIGSSLEVMPVAGLPMRVVERSMPLIMVNYTETYIDVRADVVLHEDLAEFIPLIVEETLGGSS